MSALDDMEERNEKAAYDRGYSDGAAQAREDLLKEIIERMQSNRGEVIRISTDATAIGVFDGTMLYIQSLRTGGDER